jgi:hypothetical protein
VKHAAFAAVFVFTLFSFAKDQEVNPADFPLAVRVVSFTMHTETDGQAKVQCEDTSIPGPYDKTAECKTSQPSTTYRDLKVQIGKIEYQARCICPAVPPGEYRGRWKDAGHLEILSPDKQGMLKPHRYAIVSANQVAVHPEESASQNAPIPCGSAATVDIVSTPTGAEIKIDGLFAGSTPSSLELSQGDHAIVIEKRGYKKWERNAKIAGGKVSIVAELDSN